ncbi:UDP-N-acetylmuramoyl-L-alanyl-D-glutamate--2,6-diaminopimelate ligase [Patescibacteria group bacterium]|nr:UDP-N-acetylmuramoyl-L-alanyl-D-glutamate--2,6-diaminopimelate ligase [Patescibacteria group bacterium]MCL5410100.1 UDP-N-acetylmuramoyl-L-alanyl-D-glutamate--2,6-diaminopimelate ligase [Patescibacteria group bacterium]
MISDLKDSIPHPLINYGKHLPLAMLANLKHGFPGKKLHVIGVTGTDGKTTTTNMIYQILKDAGLKVSMISTINAVIAGKVYDTGFHVTSPDAEQLQSYLKKSLFAGDEYVVLEVTSHALDQFRVWGINFEIGVITNITHEHLDYHSNLDNYLLAKAKLIKNTKWAVLNKDDSNFIKLSQLTKGKVISFSTQKNADYNLTRYPLQLQIPGEYNLSNALAAASVASILGLDKKLIKKSLENFKGLVGRMEEIPNKRGVKIVVDFAHTPNALQEALQTLRPKGSGRLFAVFGCAGARDVGKRPLMGAIAARLADVIVLTDEDPRFENREVIIGQIARGAIEEGAIEGVTLFRQPERKKAIKLAIEMAKKGDVVGIFGKGHEKSMNYRGVEEEWSDQQAVKEILVHGK